MSFASELRVAFDHCLDRSQRLEHPYGYWQLSRIFPPEVVDRLLELELVCADMDYSAGRRETNNPRRSYFSVNRRRSDPVCDAVAGLFQDSSTVAAIQKTFGSDIDNTFLRIEYAQDCDGFWLEPHTDLGVKKLTLFVYLSSDRGSENWGTSIYSDANTLFTNTPHHSNCGILFHPSPRTWHGFERRPIDGIRKSLIINYVTNEWRARHELAFPDQSVAVAA